MRPGKTLTLFFCRLRYSLAAIRFGFGGLRHASVTFRRKEDYVHNTMMVELVGPNLPPVFALRVGADGALYAEGPSEEPARRSRPPFRRRLLDRRPRFVRRPELVSRSRHQGPTASSLRG